MRLILLSVLATGVLFSSGCSLHEVRGEVAGVDVEARTDEGRGKGDGDFCPPGQAKKGNC